MALFSWINLHRLWSLGIGVAVLIAAVAAGAWFFMLRSPTTQLDLRQALRLYRHGQGTTDDEPSRGLPASGVYRYRTSGAEHLSLGDITRTFPPSTAVIVTDARCSTMRWEPFEQHVEGLVACPAADGALSIVSIPSYEEIAGTTTTTVVECPTDTYLLPPDPVVGRRWRSTCRAPGQTVVVTGQVVDTAPVDIGGAAMPAVHTRLSMSMSGSESGTNPNDYWLSASTGLILRQSETVDVSQAAGPLGAVHYDEHMSIALTSAQPAR